MKKLLFGLIVGLASLTLQAQQPTVRAVTCTDAGSTDAYACSPTITLGSYATNQRVQLYANTANTGAATINISSLGAKTIKKAAGGITTDLADNDIRAGQIVDLVYDGTNFQMQSTLGNAAAGGGGGTAIIVREFPAAVCQSAAGSLALNVASAYSPTPNCFISGTGGGVVLGVADFSDSATYALQGSFLLPATFSSIDFRTSFLTAQTNTSLNAVTQLQTGCVGDGEGIDVTWNTAQTVTSAAKGTANQLIVASISNITTTGCASGDRLYWRVYRDPTHASDTLAATASYTGFTFVINP